MAWGKPSNNVDDLVEKLVKNSSKSMYILSMRKINTKNAVSLARALGGNESVEEFYISGHDIGYEGIRAFSDALKVNKTLKKLCLGTDTFGDEGAIILCEGLRENEGLEILDLENKAIGVEGMKAISLMLSKNSSIREVLLSRNGISDAALSELAAGLECNNKVSTLDLSNNSIKYLHTLCSHLNKFSTLQHLNLSFNPLEATYSTFASSLCLNKSIISLNLNNCRIENSFCGLITDFLAKSAALEALDLGSNKITGDGVCTLSEGFLENKSLKKLILSKNLVNDSGAIALVNALSQRQDDIFDSLDLSSCELTYASMNALLTLNIRQLNLMDNKLQNDVDKIVTNLNLNTSLEVLDLSANSLHEDNAVILLNSLVFNSTLKTLVLGGNNLGNSGTKALEDLREKNIYIDVAIDKKVTEEGSQ